jgi:Catalytic LigB subunit of aromatic ring-opening dioxygenase
MARLVAAFGSSHSIMLNATFDNWLKDFRERDRGLEFFDRAGRRRTFDEALTLAPPNVAELITPERLREKFDAAHANIARMKKEIAAAELDTLIVIGDDQRELFPEAHTPTIALYYGETIRNAAPVVETDWHRQARQFFREEKVDAHHPCDAPLARHLIEGLVARDFDLSAIKALEPDEFEGHAYGFIHRRYIGGTGVKMVPVFINTYYPPNQPTPRRCVNLGAAIAELVANYPGDQRVGILGSGGLTHFLIDAEFDNGIIDAFRRKDVEYLARLDAKRLQSGSSEIRNWLVVGGAVGTLNLTWADYIPGYRSLAMTGTGLCWAVWR